MTGQGDHTAEQLILLLTALDSNKTPRQTLAIMASVSCADKPRASDLQARKGA
jgi:hypothetical protein